MKEKVKEFEIKAHYHFNSNMTIEAASREEAEKIARKTLLQLCKEEMKYQDNIVIDIIKEHVITPEERTNLENMGVIEKLPERKKREPKKKDEKVDLDQKTKTKTTKRTKK
jgi:uncharacterized protein with von Willebrand factor type A (vWA) domain